MPAHGVAIPRVDGVAKVSVGGGQGSGGASPRRGWPFSGSTPDPPFHANGSSEVLSGFVACLSGGRRTSANCSG